MSKPLGPYTPAIRAGDWVICSGQLGLQNGSLVGESVGAQVTQALANMQALLAEHGASLADVVKCTVFLDDMADYTEMNDAYMAAFSGHRPTRSAFEVAALPLGARVEIEGWAFTGDRES